MEDFVLTAIKFEKQVNTLLDKHDKKILGNLVSREKILDGGLVTAISAGFATKYNVENMEVLDKFIDDISIYKGLELRRIEEKKLKSIEIQLGEILDTII